MNFSIKKQRELLKLKSHEDIVSAKLVREFTDDGILCADAKINGAAVDLYWCGPHVIGAFDYADDSEKAKKKIFKAVQNEIEISIECMFDLSDEELTSEIKKHRLAYKSVLQYIRERGKRSSLWKQVAGHSDHFSKDFDLVDLSTMKLK